MSRSIEARSVSDERPETPTQEKRETELARAIHHHVDPKENAEDMRI